MYMISIILLLYSINAVVANNTCLYTTCSCNKSIRKGYDIDCPSIETSKIKISLDLETRLYGLNCQGTKNYMNYLPDQYLPTEIAKKKLDLDEIEFESCNLPVNTTLQDVMDYLKIKSTKLLSIRFSDLINIKRKDLKGLEEVEKLVVMKNKFGDLPDDLLYDLKNLKSLDFSSNNVVFPQNFFKTTKNLLSLDLNNNMLPKNVTYMFSNLPNIIRLSMWSMQIENLDEDIFKYIPSIGILDLSINKLTTLSPKTFNELTKMIELSLRKNNLQQLPEGIFDNNINLQILKLDENENLSILPPKIFKNLKYLQKLRLNLCNLKTLDDNTFEGLINLKEINLSSNKLTTLPHAIFKDLKSLEILNIAENDLQHLPSYMFEKLQALKDLDLSENKLKLSDETFYGLQNLTRLSLKNNRLTHISKKTLNNLHKLQKLNLADNQLSTLHIPDLNELRILILRNNSIDTINESWRMSMTRLEDLILDENKFTAITANNLDFISNNVYINLRNNLIKDINMDDAELIFSNRKSKQIQIYLGGNPIHCSCNLYNFYRYVDKTMDQQVRTTIKLQTDHLTCATPSKMNNTPVNTIKSKDFICDLNEENLYVDDVCLTLGNCLLNPANETLYIDYSDNSLTMTPSINNNIIPTLLDKYGYLNTLKITLNISRNNIESLSQQEGYDNVTVLDISYNKLKNIGWFPESTQSLFLHGNKLSKINSTELKLFNNSNIQKVAFYDNPWDCSCDTLDFVKYLQDNFKKVLSLHKINCADSNLELVNLTVEQLCPLSQGILMVSLISVAVISFIITILSILFYRYNIEIKVWLYAHQYCLWWVTEEEIDKNKLFDAFISYSHKDEDFIISELLPKLEEGANPYKLCLHFRNWKPGEFITTNIARSIAESRRTIVILSSNFLQSEWGKMEFRTAHTQALNEGRARVIIILLNDIPTDDLDDELKAYLGTNTYLKWGDPWFWNKLRYALPHQQKLFKQNISDHIVNIYDDKFDLIHDPNSPIVSTPPADKLKFEPELLNNKAININLVNNTLINNSINGIKNEKNSSIIA